MIQKLKIVYSENYNPYYNLALEEVLLKNVLEHEMILYLWQNQHTVVIGRNQHEAIQCHLSKMALDGCLLSRRLSGGGAVYHDLGNLNFTFITQLDHYSIEKNNQVIIDALKSVGIEAYVSGRNDLLVDGYKFSGHAYYQTHNNGYHHGTLMVEVDKTSLGKYLNVNVEKLKSHGVDSVRSRVTNLVDYQPNLTIEKLKSALVSSLEHYYQLKSEVDPLSEQTINEVEKLEQKYASKDWLYHPKLMANLDHQKRYPWGEIGVQAKVSQQKLTDIIIHSDAMNTEFVHQLQDLLTQAPFDQTTLIELIEKSTIEVKSDIIDFIKELF